MFLQNESGYLKQKIYISPLFKKSYSFCRNNYDKIYILSAKYGVLDPETIIENYDLTLSNFSVKDRKEWAMKCITQLDEIITPDDEIYWFAGIHYRKYLADLLPNKQYNLVKSLGIGKQLSFYNNNNVNPCANLFF